MKTRLKIIHETHYHFGAEVFIEPHYLRFKPRVTPHNDLAHFALNVLPGPTGISEQFDAENNLLHFCWFSELHEELRIRSESVVLLEENNPFNFILFPDFYFDVPFVYPLQLAQLLSAAQKTDSSYEPLVHYGNNILSNSGRKTLSFLSALTVQIHQDFTVETRLEGEPREPWTTFDLKKGSCRDLSWMQIQLLRQLGIAARFVSGYFFVVSEHPEPELHAWVEVFLPGAGWVGFDPSHGILAGSSHIPVCSSSHYENTMPVTGSFRGDASSKLTTTLSLERI